MDKTWALKEDIGHLIDCESLWQRRLEDIINYQIEISPAGLQKTKTHLVNQNVTSLQTLLCGFRKTSQQTTISLHSINDKTVFKPAFHPRFKTPTRTMNLLLFVAGHDHLHLANITELLKLKIKKK